MLLVAVLAAFLALYNNVLNLWPTQRALYVPLNLAVAAGVVAAARMSGLSWGTLGLSRAQLGPGLRWGLGIAAVIGLGLGVAYLVPQAQPLLADRRVAGLGAAGLAYTALVRIPFGTALTEELAFRGVLYGAWAERRTVLAGVVGSSLVFGLWHIVPALAMIRINAFAGLPGGRTLLVGIAVVATAIGGGLFCWLRIHTGGVLAPAIVHAALNSFATVAAFAAQR